MYDTLLFLHVLGAFLLVATLGVYWAMYVAGPGGGALLRLSGVALPLWGLASISVIVFGIWLALQSLGNAGLWSALIAFYVARGGLQGARYPALYRATFAKL